MDDDELKRQVRRAARGDERAAGALFDYYHPRVYSYALAKLRNPADADDVAAETFARVLRELDRFRWKGGGFGAWVFRIASNLVVDKVRLAGRETPVDDTAQADAADPDVTPESALLRGELIGDLDRVLTLLPREQREVLILRFGAGLDTRETAEVMGKSPNAVRQLQFRALEGLRRKMALREVT